MCLVNPGMEVSPSMYQFLESLLAFTQIKSDDCYRPFMNSILVHGDVSFLTQAADVLSLSWRLLSRVLMQSSRASFTSSSKSETQGDLLLFLPHFELLLNIINVFEEL